MVDKLVNRLTDRPNLLSKVEEIVNKELNSGEIPPDSRLVGIGIVDSKGVKLVASVELLKNNINRSFKLKAIFEHDWDGNDSIAGKVVFTSK